MVRRSFISYIYSWGYLQKRVFLHITTYGEKPFKLIPMDLEFPIIPILTSFLNIFIYCLFLLCFLAQYWPFNQIFLNCSLSIYNLPPIFVKGICIFFIQSTGQGMVMGNLRKSSIISSQYIDFLTLIISLERFKQTLNKVKCYNK